MLKATVSVFLLVASPIVSDNFRLQLQRQGTRPACVELKSQPVDVSDRISFRNFQRGLTFWYSNDLRSMKVTRRFPV